jgi:hypothetical protein
METMYHKAPTKETDKRKVSSDDSIQHDNNES